MKYQKNIINMIKRLSNRKDNRKRKFGAVCRHFRLRCKRPIPYAFSVTIVFISLTH